MKVLTRKIPGLLQNIAPKKIIHANAKKIQLWKNLKKKISGHPNRDFGQHIVYFSYFWDFLWHREWIDIYNFSTILISFLFFLSKKIFSLVRWNKKLIKKIFRRENWFEKKYSIGASRRKANSVKRLHTTTQSPPSQYTFNPYPGFFGTITERVFWKKNPDSSLVTSQLGLR